MVRTAQNLFLLRHCFVVGSQCTVLPVYYQCPQDIFSAEIKEREGPSKFHKKVFRYEIRMKYLSRGFFFNTCNQVLHVLDFNLLTHAITDTRLFLVTEPLTKKIIIKSLLIIDSTKKIYYS